MSAYTNEQLNTIYSLLGFNFYVDFDPNIKSTIIATQSQADNGDQPDDTLQLKVLSICDNLTGLMGNENNIDQQLLNLTNLYFVQNSSTGSTINPAKADFMLRRNGRAQIKQLCIIFAIKGVRQDYFGTAKKHYIENGGVSYFPDDDF